jgi:hypothetical protein
VRLCGTSAHESLNGIRDAKVPDIPDCILRVALINCGFSCSSSCSGTVPKVSMENGLLVQWRGRLQE